MSKDVSEKVSLELTLLAALDSVHADVDTSKIAEIKDWSRAVRGKFYGASVRKPSRLSKFKAGLLSALKRPKAADAPHSSPGGFRGVVTAASGNVASHGSVQYSQMAIPQLIAACTSESSEGAWSEFIRRFQPLIATVITKAVRRFGNVSYMLVDDLSQEVYVRLCADNFRTLRSIATADSFFGFVRAIAAHTAQDYFRKSAASKVGGGQALEVDHLSAPASSPGASSESERKVLLEEIDSILKTHAHEPNFERDYAIFWLYYRHGFTATEIAASPGVTLDVKGVESTLLRLTRQMRVALKPKAKDPAE